MLYGEVGPGQIVLVDVEGEGAEAQFTFQGSVKGELPDSPPLEHRRWPRRQRGPGRHHEGRLATQPHRRAVAEVQASAAVRRFWGRLPNGEASHLRRNRLRRRILRHRDVSAAFDRRCDASAVSVHFCDGSASLSGCGSGGEGVAAAVVGLDDQAVGEQAGRARSRWTASDQTASSRARATLPSASRSTAISRPRTWRSVPAQAWPRRGGPSYAGRPASVPGAQVVDRAASQRGLAAVQTRAPSSITATAQVAGCVVGDQRLGPLALGLGDRRGRELHAAHRAGEHPAHVGVEHGVAGPEREGRDRAGGVVADPRQREQVLVGRPAPRRRAGPRSPWQRRAGAAPGAGSRAGPTPGPLRRSAPRRAPAGSARSPSRTRRRAAPGRPASAGA